MINYSIIIPHKDIPDLLQRCQDSIPVRDDVEVIVVDDNSDPEKVEFDRFPQWAGKNYHCFLTKEGRGAGYARNVGLEHATGRWVIFADADDFFTEDFGSLLDEMADAEEDIVFFDYINVLSQDITQQVEDRVWYKKMIAAYREGSITDASFRVGFVVPWCRLVRKELVESNHIRFSETRWSNDVYFSAQVNGLAKSIKVSEKTGYVFTNRRGSLSYDVCATAKELKTRLQEGWRAERFYAQHGIHAKGALTSPHLLRAYNKHGFGWCVWFCVINVFDKTVFMLMAAFLAKKLKNRMKALHTKSSQATA